MEAQRRAGRPTTAAKEGEKATLGIRAAPKLKGQLIEASNVSGRSLSAEAELRLEQSFIVERLISTSLIDVMQEIERAGSDFARGLGIEDNWRANVESCLFALESAVVAFATRVPGDWDCERITDAVKRGLNR